MKIFHHHSSKENEMTKSDEFVTRVQQRAEGQVSGRVAGFQFLPLLLPLIQAAISALIQRMGSCGDPQSKMIELVNSGSVRADAMVSHCCAEAVHDYWNEIKRSERGPARRFMKEMIVAEAKETDDAELDDTLDENSTNPFNPFAT